jgi:hypothetical protein
MGHRRAAPIGGLAALVVLSLVLTSGGDAAAQVPGTGGYSPSFQIGGAVARPMTIDQAALIARPQTNVLQQCFYTDTLQPETHVYRGVSLWSLLNEAGLTPPPGPSPASLRGYIVVTGSDGYEIVIGLAGLDPEFEGRPIIVAYLVDGEFLPQNRGMARLIVSSDRTCMRSVWWLAKVEVRYVD